MKYIILTLFISLNLNAKTTEDYVKEADACMSMAKRVARRLKLPADERLILQEMLEDHCVEMVTNKLVRDVD